MRESEGIRYYAIESVLECTNGIAGGGEEG